MTITKRIEKFINATAAIDASINGFDLQDSIKEITEQIVTNDYSNWKSPEKQIINAE